jgi:hypothetical protein
MAEKWEAEKWMEIGCSQDRGQILFVFLVCFVVKKRIGESA